MAPGASPSDPLSHTARLLRNVPVLAGIDDALLARVAGIVTPISLTAGEWLFKQGNAADVAYVVASGRLEVVVDETVIRVMRRGAALGELGLLTGGERSASVRARSDATLISLRREAFELLLRDVPSFSLALTREIAQRLASTTSGTASTEPPRTVAVVSLGHPAPGALAASALTDELQRHGRVVNIRSPFAEESREWASCLDRAESVHDWVVLAAGGSEPSDPWTAFCLGEADRIVALTTGEVNPAWRGAEAKLAGCELVAVGRAAAPGRVPAGNVRIVTDEAGVSRVMSQLGRRIAGRSIAVVLSGGGARALSHIGALEELDRAGVRIDRIGGVSLGAVVAAFVARGDAAQELYGHADHYFVKQNPTNDYTLPLVSLIRGRKTASMLSREFGEIQIEELHLPFFCTTADPGRHELIVHRTGPLAWALLASLSIPGVFPPAVDPDGRLLVDGGVLDNLPVRTMAEGREGPVIAVDVTGVSTRARRAPRNDGRLAAVAAAIRRAITGTDARLPPLPETIIRCMTLASADTVAMARRHADLVITPDVTRIGMLEWHRLPEMRAAGAAAVRQALNGNAALVAE